MTCIVAYVDEKTGKIVMGGDSAGVAGLDVTVRRDVKVFKVDKRFLIGYTSSFRMRQLLRFSLKVPKQKKTQTDYEFMCTDFIEAVRITLINGGYAEISSNREEIGNFLVGYKGVIYNVASDLQVGYSYDPYDSVGCGSKYALGALACTDKYNIKQKVTGALEVATKFSGGVRPPYVLETL
jgi:hypothetical protein